LSEPAPGRPTVIGLLWLTAVATAVYWIDFFTAGSVQVVEDECYQVFEAAFPMADGWMAGACVVSAEGLRRRRAWAVPWGIAAGSALVFLGCMDVLYNLEHGLYAIANVQMAGEIFINVWCFTLGPGLMIYLWRHRRALDPVRTLGAP
jgi:hypothetical protein